MLLSAVLLWLCATLTMTAAEAFSPWGLPLVLFRHISQLEGGSSWLSRLGWGLGEAEVSIVVSVRIVAPGPLTSRIINSIRRWKFVWTSGMLFEVAYPTCVPPKYPALAPSAALGRRTGAHWNIIC